MSNPARTYHHAHHFPSAQDESEAAKARDVGLSRHRNPAVFGLFMAYASYRYTHPEMFKTVHQLLDWKLGAVNTMVPILSSLTMALSVRSAQLSSKDRPSASWRLPLCAARPSWS